MDQSYSKLFYYTMQGGVEKKIKSVKIGFKNPDRRF